MNPFQPLNTDSHYIKRHLDKQCVVEDIIDNITSDQEERAYLHSLTVSVDLIGE